MSLQAERVTWRLAYAPWEIRTWPMNRLTLAPTTLPDTPPLEFIKAAVDAGFEGLGFRLHKSPAYPNWQNWLGDAALKRDVRAALASSGQKMVESLSYYLSPEFDLDEMRPSLEFAAELGATYALVIGSDENWSRMRDNFGRFCDTAGGFGLTAAIEAPVRTLSPIERAFQIIEETGCGNAVVCIDPTAFLRAGDTPDVLAGRDQRLLPYAQLNDGRRDSGGRMRRGDGQARVADLLDALPSDIPLSLEWPAPKDETHAAIDWARFVMAGTRRFLSDYYISRPSRATTGANVSISRAGTAK
jgi:sugar phosphate isomerase/epimerase